jgi:hypothetical protein
VSRILDDPKLVRWLVAVFLGIPVALTLSVSFPERQTSQFVPFVATSVVAFGIIALIAYGAETWVTKRRREAGRRPRR